ncbi:DME family drug/metabolite transporter [Herbihabitans rhizosphaerae]|uniref:DME family drug/metabolite transporter n=1 Tax=Herbihabitans rhizosphaerae TaxID=1872711 RepID=A0A4Q7L620_9PSEU|nr:DMT family transporter [Herbihabitans rhizosphaerae]RZS45119.1 DME family drug/metabolite transporter [Herbihabitans rhizosphaerae]
MSANRSTLLLVTAGILWGTGGLSGSILADDARLDPLAVAAYRLLIGGALATVVVATRLRAARTRAAARRILATGALLAVFQTAYFTAVSSTSVSLATLITIGSVPVFVTGATAVLERRLPDTVTLVSITVALAGLALLSGNGGTATVLGIGAALVAGAGFATLTVINRRPVDGLDAATTTALGLLTGGLLLLPVALPLGMAVPLTATGLAAVAFLGLVPTAIAYGAYFAGLRRGNAVAAALAAMLEPLTATVLSVLLLHERLTGLGMIGAALLLGALLVSYLPRSRAAVQL